MNFISHFLGQPLVSVEAEIFSVSVVHAAFMNSVFLSLCTALEFLRDVVHRYAEVCALEKSVSHICLGCVHHHHRVETVGTLASYYEKMFGEMARN